jgi:hypothetical protein
VLTTVLVISAAFFAVAPDIAWFALAPVPVILWGSFRFQRLLEPRYARVREQVGRRGRGWSPSTGSTCASCVSKSCEARSGW